MAWGKCLIISLGLMLITQAAHARDIETFTDSQGTLHITNFGSTKQKSPANPPNPAASPDPGNVPGQVPVTLPGSVPVPGAQPPAPKPEAAPKGPVPVAPQPGSRVTHTEGLGRVMQAAYRTGGQDEPGIAAGVPSAPRKQVSWSPPQPVKPVPNGKITLHRDRQGVIHITNVLQEGEEPATPVTPAPAVQKQTLPPEVALPAVRQVSCPELGPEVADYLEAKLRAHAPALDGTTIHRYKDHRGVWQIRNEPAPDLQFPQARLASFTGEITAPALAHGPPVTPTPPAMAWGPGFVSPPPGTPDQKVVARRDHRGVLHIFTWRLGGVYAGSG